MFINENKIASFEKMISLKKEIINEFEFASKNSSYLMNFLKSSDPEFTNHTKYWLIENNIDSEQTGYDLRTGIWGAFPLYKKGFPIKWYNADETFPVLNELFSKFPQIEFACFMRLEAKQSIELHTHSRQHYIFHMLMNELNNEGCEFSCGSEHKTIKHVGDTLCFDYSLPHKSFNSSDFDRINLVVDIKP